MEWSRKLELLARRQGFRPWLEGTLPCPNITTAPEANFVWTRNDDSLSGFIIDHVSPTDAHLIEKLSSSYLMFEKLHAQHEQLGAFAQLNLLLKGIKIDFDYDINIRDKIAKMRTYYHRIVSMGSIKDDDIFKMMLLNGMNKHFGPLQQTIHSMSSLPNFSSETIVNRLLSEASLIQRRIEAGESANPYIVSSVPTLSTFAATPACPRPPHPLCANCKREGHGTDFCVASGGKRAGHSVDEAHAAYRAMLPPQPKPQETTTARPPPLPVPS